MLPFPKTIFITTFLQTAANPSFRQNLLHSQLYRKHVLAEDVPGAPSINPPYLTDEMFSIIRKVRERSSMNITTTKQKDWTQKQIPRINNIGQIHRKGKATRTKRLITLRAA